MKSVIKALSKSALMPLGLTAAASAANIGIHKKILWSGATALIISNDEIRYIIRIVKSLADSGLLLKGVSEIIQNAAKEQKGEILSMLLGTPGANLFHILADEGMNRAGEGFSWAGYGSSIKNKDF